MTVNREGAGSPFRMGTDEEIAWLFDFEPWGGSPTSPGAKIYDSQNTDQTSTNLSGSSSVSGDIVTTPQVLDLIAGERYRLIILVTIDGNKESAYIYIDGEL